MDIGCCMVAYGIRGHIWWAPAAVRLFLSTQAAAKGSTHQISGRAGKSTRVEKLDHPNRITTFRVDDDDDDGHSNWPEEQQVAPGGVSSSPFPRGRGGCWWQQMDAVTCQLKFTLQILLSLWWYLLSWIRKGQTTTPPGSSSNSPIDRPLAIARLLQIIEQM